MTVGLGDGNRISIDVLAKKLRLKNDMGKILIYDEAEDSSSRSELGRKRRSRRNPQSNEPCEGKDEERSVTEGEGEGEGAKGKARSFRSPASRPRKSKQQGTPRSTVKAKV